jgi:hypothetical protein
MTDERMRPNNNDQPEAAMPIETRSRKSLLDKYIHQENLALFKKRLTEPHDAARHKMLLKLLADEEAKDRNYLGDLYLS